MILISIVQHNIIRIDFLATSNSCISSHSDNHSYTWNIKFIPDASFIRKKNRILDLLTDHPQLERIDGYGKTIMEKFQMGIKCPRIETKINLTMKFRRSNPSYCSRIHCRHHYQKKKGQASSNLMDKIRPLTKEWHGSEEGKKWHQAHGILSWKDM